MTPGLGTPGPVAPGLGTPGTVMSGTVRPGTVPRASQALSDRTAAATRGSEGSTVIGVSEPNGMNRIRPFPSRTTELSGR